MEKGVKALKDKLKKDLQKREGKTQERNA